MRPTLDEARALDAADPLAHFRQRFLIGDDPRAYLDGNSLGRPPKSTIDRVTETMETGWGEQLIRSWGQGWTSLPGEVGDRLAAAVIGAGPGQTLIADSTSVNLYKVLHAACSIRADRHEIVVDDANFPTDRYLVESVAASRGLDVRWIRPPLADGVTSELLADVLGSKTAAVLLSHVDYRSGTIADLEGLTGQIQAAGAVAIWDLCHSAGAVPVALDAARADFAVGCTYKYLNAGPGAPAFLYVAERHIGSIEQPIRGWWSSKDMFAMASEYEPAPTIEKMLSGTANVLGIIAVDEGVKLVAEAGIERIREKSSGLTEFAISLVSEPGMEIVTPRQASIRGSHISLRCPRAREITTALIERQVVPDFRNPGMIRIGLSPLTTSYEEVWTAMDDLREVSEVVGAGPA